LYNIMFSSLVFCVISFSHCSIYMSNMYKPLTLFFFLSFPVWQHHLICPCAFFASILLFPVNTRKPGINVTNSKKMYAITDNLVSSHADCFLFPSSILLCLVINDDN
jgi:hypothetical protein